MRQKITNYLVIAIGIIVIFFAILFAIFQQGV